MTYYEELGLTESASMEEIRQAYKSLARLLHPDHQAEEQLRKVAQLQMMRLNEILAVLTDPLAREKYNAAMRMAFAVTAEVRSGFYLGRSHFSVGAIAWSAALVVAAVVFSFALLYFDHGPAAPVYEGSSQLSVHPPPPVVPNPPNVEEPAAAPPVTRNPGGEVRIARPSQPPPMPALKQDAPAAPAPIPLAAPDPPSTAPVAADSRNPLAGTWLYTQSNGEAGTPSNLAYRPEYIEMIVRPKDGGNISGRYLGRFRVPDRAISSEVRFAFEGAVNEDTTVLPWHSNEGAEGQVRMKLVSNGALEVTWFTTRFGSARRLVSGTAVLRRD
jgi:hypothetical protein